jgi:hypothetical protein
MRESRLYGSVRGARGNSRPYRYRTDFGCTSRILKVRGHGFRMDGARGMRAQELTDFVRWEVRGAEG